MFNFSIAVNPLSRCQATFSRPLHAWEDSQYLAAHLTCGEDIDTSANKVKVFFERSSLPDAVYHKKKSNPEDNCRAKKASSLYLFTCKLKFLGFYASKLSFGIREHPRVGKEQKKSSLICNYFN